MTEHPTTEITYRRRDGIWLLITAIVAITLLIFANYYTLKVANSIRAYIQGESEYSKAQKNAAINLILYAESGNDKYYDRFQKEISIPYNDGLVLKKLRNSASFNDLDRAQLRIYFIKGNNHPDDIDNVIWLFRTFSEFDFMRKAFEIWVLTDSEIESLIEIGNEIHNPDVLSAIAADSEIRNEYIQDIERFSGRFDRGESRFSNILGGAAREMKHILFWINILMVGFIFLLLGWFYRRVIRNMKNLNNVLLIQNTNLTETNYKLDQFIYATSHDLKAPVNNLQGLVNIARMHNKTADTIEDTVLDKMETSLTSLTGNMEDIENMIQMYRNPFRDFEYLEIEPTISQTMQDCQIIRETEPFETVLKLHVKSIYFSKRGMTNILHNLFYNAVKYRSADRKLSIRIETRYVNGGIILTMQDNGMGVDLKKEGYEIADMLRNFREHRSESRLGLYALRRILERNGGNITVESKVGIGTTCKIFFKK